MGFQGRDETSDIPIASSKPLFTKKPLFSKRVPADTLNSEPQTGLESFMRAKDVFSAQVKEQDRRRQEQQTEKDHARSRSTVSVEKDSTLREPKRRRISSQEADGEDSPDGARQCQSIDSTPRSQTSPVKTKASPRSALHRHNDKSSENTAPRPPNKAYISLDDSDNEVWETNSRTKPDVIDADGENLLVTSRKDAPTPISDDENDVIKQTDDPETQFGGKYIAQAQEKRRQEALAREKALPFIAGTSELDIFKTEPEYNDPTIDLFITSRIPGSKELLVRRKFSQGLKQVRLEWCRKQNVGGRPFTPGETDQVFFTYNMKKQWDVSTCADMGFKLDRQGTLQNNGTDSMSSTRVHLEAWLPEVMKAYEKTLADSASGVQSDQLKQSKEKKVKLILRSKDYGDFKVNANKTTTFEEIANGFHNVKSVPDDKTIILRLDGEDLSPNGNVEAEDLEDLVIIEVIIR